MKRKSLKRGTSNLKSQQANTKILLRIQEESLTFDKGREQMSLYDITIVTINPLSFFCLHPKKKGCKEREGVKKKKNGKKLK